MAKLPTEQGIHNIYTQYVEYCKSIERIPTKNGLCIALDITRETYNQWKKKSDTLKKVEQEIEEYWVERLKGNNVAGIIFYLKNAFQYRDNKGVDITTKGKRLGLFNYVQNRKNNSNSKDKGDEKENKDSSGRNISK